MKAEALFERIARSTEPSTGWGLFTVTAFDASSLEVERVWSSNPAAYPVGGRKKKRDTEFSRHILLGGKTLVCEGDARIAAIFDDCEKIRSLGMHSSINVPVLSEGRCVGVLNFLMTAEGVSAAQRDAAEESARDAEVIELLAHHLG